jgi:hypothetical protein
MGGAAAASGLIDLFMLMLRLAGVRLAPNRDIQGLGANRVRKAWMHPGVFIKLRAGRQPGGPCCTATTPNAS